jgi:hypothetical protein
MWRSCQAWGLAASAPFLYLKPQDNLKNILEFSAAFAILGLLKQTWSGEMGKPTKMTVWTVRQTGRGSDHYGACELCGKSCSEHFVAMENKIYVRENGQHYLSGGVGYYGHLDCLTTRFGSLLDEKRLPRDANITRLPEEEVFKLLA